MDSFLEISEDVLREHPGLALVAGVVLGVQRKPANRAVQQAKEQALPNIENDLQQIKNAIQPYHEFFHRYGYTCPLQEQLERTVQRGFAQLNRFVDMLLVAEMSSGVLMGAQDFSMMKPPLRFDVAHADESFEGMRNDSSCKAGEPIIRDQDGIVASYFQGSDKRTAIKAQTRDVIYFGFGMNSVSIQNVVDAVEVALAALEPCSEKVLRQVVPPVST